MKEIESIIIFPQYLLAKPMRIVMEMVTAMPENANAYLIMSMPRIAPIMDVSTCSKPLCFFLILNDSKTSIMRPGCSKLLAFEKNSTGYLIETFSENPDQDV